MTSVTSNGSETPTLSLMARQTWDASWIAVRRALGPSASTVRNWTTGARLAA
jgi:hypothetical protein